MTTGMDKGLFADFVEKDNRCHEMLGEYFQWLQAPQGGELEPKRASDMGHAADRYLREYVVDIMELAPEALGPSLALSYLGNWYIVNTLIPSHEEVDLIAEALSRFHEWAAKEGVINPAIAEKVIAVLAEAERFHQRLEQFWELTPEEVEKWLMAEDYLMAKAVGADEVQ